MDALNPEFEYSTLVWHDGMVIGLITECATDDESRLYDGWLGWLGLSSRHCVVHGVDRSTAIATVVRAHLS